MPTNGRHTISSRFQQIAEICRRRVGPVEGREPHGCGGRAYMGEGALLAKHCFASARTHSRQRLGRAPEGTCSVPSIAPAIPRIARFCRCRCRCSSRCRAQPRQHLPQLAVLLPRGCNRHAPALLRHAPAGTPRTGELPAQHDVAPTESARHIPHSVQGPGPAAAGLARGRSHRRRWRRSGPGPRHLPPNQWPWPSSAGVSPDMGTIHPRTKEQACVAPSHGRCAFSKLSRTPTDPIRSIAT